jgi:hypothetical protein
MAHWYIPQVIAESKRDICKYRSVITRQDAVVHAGTLNFVPIYGNRDR